MSHDFKEKKIKDVTGMELEQNPKGCHAKSIQTYWSFLSGCLSLLLECRWRPIDHGDEKQREEWK